ncbi:MAG: hypothetical protein ABFD49_06160 [Armatimonadota bacterium]|nr:hypothetical protein [bacterium]
MRACVLTRLLLVLLMVAALACTAAAQNPDSCSTSGFSGYNYFATNDGTNTTLHFTFFNLSPISSIYVNIGEIFFYGLPAPVGTPTAPSGWQFNNIASMLFYDTTSNPWWKTPPAIKPGDSLSGFDYTIAGLTIPTFSVFTHVQNVTDATGQTAGSMGSWFDCSIIYNPPPPNPCISVTKTPSPTSGYTGDVITYTYKVCNCGNLTLTVTSVLDNLLGELLDNFKAANGGSAILEPEDCVEFSVDRTLISSDPDPLPNCVTVFANPPMGPPVMNTKCASVRHLGPEPMPSITIAKTPVPSSGVTGDEITYTYKVCNNGNTDLTVTSIVDDVLGDLLAAFIAANGSAELPIGDCTEFAVQYTLKADDPDPLKNCVEVTADPPEGSSVDATACAFVMHPPNPCVSIEKTPSPTTGATGDIITYTYKICNCGDTSLTVTSVLDDLLGDLLADFVAANGGATLAVGACAEFSVNRALQSSDSDPLQNCVIVNALPAAGPPVDAQTCASVRHTGTEPFPNISVDKTPTPNSGQTGDLITYTYKVCNSGNSDLTVTSISDDVNGDLLAAFIAANGGSDELGIGDCVEFTALRELQQSDPNPLINCVTVVASPQVGSPVSASKCAFVQHTPPRPAPCVSVLKFPVPSRGFTGDVITYHYKVCNCGNTNLTVTTVSDNVLGDLLSNFVEANGGSDALAIGECVEFTVDHTLLEDDPEYIVNCVIVQADSTDGSTVGAYKCAQVHHIQIHQGPCIDLTKSVYPNHANVGQQVTYTYEVCNCGTEALNVNSFVDTVLGDLLPSFIAANNGSDVLDVETCVSFDVVYEIPPMEPGAIRNCATVTTTQGVEGTYCARLDVGENEWPRRCYLPVTFTQEGWHTFCDPNNIILPGGILYNRFPLAFAEFMYYGDTYKNKIIVGKKPRTLTFTGTKFGLTQLCNFLPQTGPCQCFMLTMDYLNPTTTLNKQGNPTANALAGETLALMLNIAYNDMRVMPRTAGYDLEKFTLTQGPFKGKAVGEVLNIANAVLAGAYPCQFGLQGNVCENINILATVIANINANYEFQDYDTYIDRGYLKPNGALGPAKPAHYPVVPYTP